MLALHGSKGKVWLEQLPALLDSLCRRWSLAIEQPLRDLSYNFVAQAWRHDGTPVMLKVGVPNDELLSEIAALRHYDGRGCVMLLEADVELGAMLLERLEPGTMLVALDDDRATRGRGDADAVASVASGALVRRHGDVGEGNSATARHL